MMANQTGRTIFTRFSRTVLHSLGCGRRLLRCSSHQWRAAQILDLFSCCVLTHLQRGHQGVLVTCTWRDASCDYYIPQSFGKRDSFFRWFDQTVESEIINNWLPRMALLFIIVLLLMQKLVDGEKQTTLLFFVLLTWKYPHFCWKWSSWSLSSSRWARSVLSASAASEGSRSSSLPLVPTWNGLHLIYFLCKLMPFTFNTTIVLMKLMKVYKIV